MLNVYIYIYNWNLDESLVVAGDKTRCTLLPLVSMLKETLCVHSSRIDMFAPNSALQRCFSSTARFDVASIFPIAKLVLHKKLANTTDKICQRP